jgi:hypothetical protein
MATWKEIYKNKKEREKENIRKGLTGSNEAPVERITKMCL